jgi:hypothetical protein
MEAIAPSAWEKLLRELHMADERVLDEIELRSEKGERLRRFVDREYARRYVPVAVLTALGMANLVEVALTKQRLDLREAE